MNEFDYEQHVCKRKVRYPTRRDAKHAAKRMARRHRERFSAYKCDICGEFHVGHSFQQARKGR